MGKCHEAKHSVLYISYKFENSIFVPMEVKFWSSWYGSHIKNMTRGFWLNVSFSSHVKSAIRAIRLALGFFEQLSNENFIILFTMTLKGLHRGYINSFPVLFHINQFLHVGYDYTALKTWIALITCNDRLPWKLEQAMWEWEEWSEFDRPITFYQRPT